MVEVEVKNTKSIDLFIEFDNAQVAESIILSGCQSISTISNRFILTISNGHRVMVNVCRKYQVLALFVCVGIATSIV